MRFPREPACSELSEIAPEHHPAIRDHCQKCLGRGRCCLMQRLREMLADIETTTLH